MKRKEPPSRRQKTQHDKFVELARELGADENEAAFVGKLRRIVKPETLTPDEIERLKGRGRGSVAAARKAFAKPKKG